MKRLLFLFLMCLPMMVVAQDDVEVMTATYVKADAMTKTQGHRKGGRRTMSATSRPSPASKPAKRTTA